MKMRTVIAKMNRLGIFVMVPYWKNKAEEKLKQIRLIITQDNMISNADS